MKKVIIQKGLFLDKIAYLIDEKLQKIKIINKNNKYFEKDIFVGKKKKQNVSMQSVSLSLDEETSGFMHYFKEDSIDYKLCQIKKIFNNDKNPKLTDEITLTGKYVVFIVGSSGISISNKSNSREILENILIDEEITKNAKIIIRSNAKVDDIGKITQEIDEFKGIYNEILNKARLISKPQLIYRQYEREELFLSKINDDIDVLIINDRQLSKSLKNSRFAPKEIIFENERNLFRKYGVDSIISELLEDKVYLGNGINLYIQTTEAMSIIDVNSAGFLKFKDRKQNNFHINKIVCNEIVRQIILRDLSGIILIDFIDMNDEILSKKLLKFMQESLKTDDRKSTATFISKSNIMQVIRKKEDLSLAENILSDNIRLYDESYIFEDVDEKISNIYNEDIKNITLEIPIFESVTAKKYLELLEKKYNIKIVAKFLKKSDFSIKVT